MLRGQDDVGKGATHKRPVRYLAAGRTRPPLGAVFAPVHYSRGYYLGTEIVLSRRVRAGVSESGPHRGQTGLSEEHA